MAISGLKCSAIETPSTSVPTARREYGSIFKAWSIWGVKLGVAFLAIVFLVKSIQPATLIEVLKSTKWPYVIFALLLVVPNILIQVLKWYYLLKQANRETPFATALNSLLVGYPLGLVTPARLGEFGRAFLVQELHRMKTLTLVLIDKAANLFVTILFGMAGLLYLLENGLLLSRISNSYNLFLIPGVVLFTIPLLLLMVKIISRHFTRVNTLSRNQYVVVALLSMVFYSIYLAQFIFLILSFKGVNPLAGSGAAASVFLTKTILPISVGDLGIREGASVFFFDKIGLTAAQAFNASILLFLINVGIPSLFGLWIFLNRKVRRGGAENAKEKYY
ncbi:MAG: lysylphosphatidylglycerol synthase transmembrane domain-containing protein [bacterium]